MHKRKLNTLLWPRCVQARLARTQRHWDTVTRTAMQTSELDCQSWRDHTEDDTGTGVSISRLQGEMRTPPCFFRHGSSNCSRSDSTNNGREWHCLQGFQSPTDWRNKGNWLIPPGPWRRQSLLLGDNAYSRCKQGSCGKRVFVFPHTTHHRSSTHSWSYPSKSEPQCLSVPWVAHKHLEASQPKKHISLLHSGLDSAHVWLLASFLFCIQQSDRSTNQTWLELSRPRSLPRERSWMVGTSLQHPQSAPCHSSGVRWLMSNRKQPLWATELWETLAYGAVQKEIWTKTCWMQKTKTRNKKKGKT